MDNLALADDLNLPFPQGLGRLIKRKRMGFAPLAHAQPQHEAGGLPRATVKAHIARFNRNTCQGPGLAQ